MSFPQRHARTRRFSLGAPRGFSISPDGSRVLFLRSKGGSDPVTCLWSLDVATGEERLVADPAALADPDAELPPEERARRERSREQAGGIVGYATDAGHTVAAFTLAGVLYLADLTGVDAVRGVSTPPGVIDPRPDPAGNRVGYVSGGALRVYDRATGTSTALAEPESDTVRYGLADFIAAEEMGRMRGYWWSPSGDAVLVARTDDAPVVRWHVADPANPDRPATVLPYPAAGTANATTELFLLDGTGRRTRVDWSGEYLADATWDGTDLLISVEPRDQRTITVLRVDTATGATSEVVRNSDQAWVDIVPGVPAHLADGTLVWTAESYRSDEGIEARVLVVGGEAVTPPSLQVRSVLDVDGDTVLFTASDDPIDIRLWTYRPGDGLSCLTPEPGVFGGRRGGGTTVITAQTLDSDGVSVTVHPADGQKVTIASLAESPDLPVRLSLVPPATTWPRGPRTAVLLPSGHRAGERLPVLMDPYGGPHAQRVLSARNAYLTSQWFADQGFAVVIADGRGTPGRGPAYEREVFGDLASPALEDQVAAVEIASAAHPELDTSRVGIRGWSFGGYLAALAVLRRPDVFHAAVAGAPVTDWRLYDTHYTERYLGDPAVEPGAYERSSLLADAQKLSRPLMLIHGLADDNVVAAHTLRLSSALLAAGRPHTVLPLSGVTHMTPQEEVAENLLLLQVDFFRAGLRA
ncbi:S9 family peptidase [Pseudonocardia spinosispora]|uniref:S9 family peptidase n=1 Tax=Pseudonocardia spinosispora TaxID=103441 RepID=UPI00048A968A|nr:prolyl oligopeptidase family serine peptidase [Pseudonocardia spinosispora]